MVVSLPATQRSWVQALELALFLIEDKFKSNQRYTRVKTQINVPTFYLRFGLKTRIYEENPIERSVIIRKGVVGNWVCSSEKRLVSKGLLDGSNKMIGRLFYPNISLIHFHGAFNP